MDNNYLVRIELYCVLIDIFKQLKLLVKTKKEVKAIELIERKLNNLMLKQRVI